MKTGIWRGFHRYLQDHKFWICKAITDGKEVTKIDVEGKRYGRIKCGGWWWGGGLTEKLNGGRWEDVAVLVENMKIRDQRR